LATLPGRDVLLGQLLGVLMSPTHGLVGTLQGNMHNLVNVLTAQAESKTKAG
jgi:ribosomal protein L10